MSSQILQEVQLTPMLLQTYCASYNTSNEIGEQSKVCQLMRNKEQVITKWWKCYTHLCGLTNLLEKDEKRKKNKYKT